nr:unnamed protein product [Callosobruchus chinensis]
MQSREGQFDSSITRP